MRGRGGILLSTGCSAPRLVPRWPRATCGRRSVCSALSAGRWGRVIVSKLPRARGAPPGGRHEFFLYPPVPGASNQWRLFYRKKIAEDLGLQSAFSNGRLFDVGHEHPCGPHADWRAVDEMEGWRSLINAASHRELPRSVEDRGTRWALGRVNPWSLFWAKFVTLGLAHMWKRAGVRCLSRLLRGEFRHTEYINCENSGAPGVADLGPLRRAARRWSRMANRRHGWRCKRGPADLGVGGGRNSLCALAGAVGAADTAAAPRRVAPSTGWPASGPMCATATTAE